MFYMPCYPKAGTVTIDDSGPVPVGQFCREIEHVLVCYECKKTLSFLIFKSTHLYYNINGAHCVKKMSCTVTVEPQAFYGHLYSADSSIVWTPLWCGADTSIVWTPLFRGLFAWTRLGTTLCINLISTSIIWTPP